MERTKIATGAEWEPLIGYSRAVRVGNSVWVSGSTSIDADGKIVGIGDPYVQTRQALSIVEAALEAAGARITDVVRTRIYVTRMEDWPEIGRAHADVFADILPATSMVEVGRLIDGRMLVEVEAEAVVEA